MVEIESFGEMNEIIRNDPFVLFYLSRADCGVCDAVRPRVETLCKKYSGLKTYFVSLDKNEIIAGQFSIFTIPAVLVFAEGKEALREARNFSIVQIEQKLDRLSELMS